MNKIIIFLIRRHLNIPKYKPFRFSNQRSRTDFYYFTSRTLMKCENGQLRKSGVALNWLLNKNCKVKFVELRPRECKSVLRKEGGKNV